MRLHVFCTCVTLPAHFLLSPAIFSVPFRELLITATLSAHSDFNPPESWPKTAELAKEHEIGPNTAKQPNHENPENASRKAQS
jgi:hypothetical protein